MIEFTQFLRPDGRQVKKVVERSKEIEDMAARLVASGAVFEVEKLSTGHISMECVVHGVGDDPFVLAGRICQDGPPVSQAVDDMIREAVSVAEKMVEKEPAR